MGYAKIDHKILTDPKTFDLQANAMSLFVRLIVWSSREETDGQVPLKVARTLGSSAAHLELTRRGLVEQVGGTLSVVGFLKHQSSKAHIELKRQKTKARVEKHREPVTPLPKNRVQRTKNKDQSTKTKRVKVPAPEHQPFHIVPDAWEPTDAHRARAAELGLNFAEALDEFRTKEFQKAYTDPHKLFHTFLRNKPKFDQQNEERRQAAAPAPGLTSHRRQQREDHPKPPYHRPFQ